MIDWKTKLCSRKFWMAIIGLVSGVLAMFRMDEQVVTQIGGIIMALGSVVAYIIGEGLIDAAHAGGNTVIVPGFDGVEEQNDENEGDG